MMYVGREVNTSHQYHGAVRENPGPAEGPGFYFFHFLARHTNLPYIPKNAFQFCTMQPVPAMEWVRVRRRRELNIALFRETIHAHFIIASILLSGCSASLPPPRRLNDGQLHSLQIIERILPVTPDSVATLYLHNDPETFHKTYAHYLTAASQLIDSLNAPLPAYLRVDTLSIDHTFENIGEAAHEGNFIYLSSSFFYLYNDSAVIRSVIFHEFGHIYYMILTQRQLRVLTEIWLDLHDPSGFYLFRDREYPHNTRFGGHPEDSPSELFASAFNLLCNNTGSIITRSWLLEEHQRPVFERLNRLIHEITDHPDARPAR